jgi:hypothetical protein
MPRMRTLLILSLVLFGCSDDKTNNTPPADAAVDAPPTGAAPTCAAYCTAIMANCTTANGAAQYADMAHCLGSCGAFTIGTSTVNDQTGDTLGCRVYHANAAAGSATNATLHCPHAGPGGDLISATTPPTYCGGGDFCTNFCTLEIATCGSIDAPATVGGVAIPPQYKNLAACVSVCKNGDSTVTPAIPAFDVTHPYATTAAGNSLACRLNHWTNAASGTVDPVNGNLTKTHCGHTGAAQTNAALPCASATPTP